MAQILTKRAGPRNAALAFAGALLASVAAASAQAGPDPAGWAVYGHDAGGQRFSPLAQIDRGNVARLKPAWTAHVGDMVPGLGTPRSALETTPIYLDGRLYVTTGLNRILALDPATGRELWAYDPRIDRKAWYGDGYINRGVAAWRDAKARGGVCALRLFEATLDARLVAVDAATGRPCAGFGASGEVSLREVANYRQGPYHMTSPPVVIDDVVVVGSAIDDNSKVDMPGGVVRGYDARTGALRWRWEPLVPSPGLRAGAANAWSVMTTDPKRHLVFAPTGSASPDYYGGLRPGDNRWANSVVALDPRTGKLAWGFQLVHHDLWDYDTASSPLLAELPHGGRKVPVVVAANKTGRLFVLDRVTGKPVFPVEERPVPQSTVPGETTSPTQPVSIGLPAVARQSLPPQDAFGFTPEDQEACRARIAGASGHELFSPPSLQGVVAIPGNAGGPNWSGMSFDPGRNLLIVNSNNLPYLVRLIPTGELHGPGHGDLRAELSPQAGAPYGMSRSPLLSPSGVPCLKSPWGELVAVDLAAGTIRWRRPLGSMTELAKGLPDGFGSVSFGGSIVTGGGLVFIGGTLDRTFRAFDVDTGNQLWSAELPASAHATPMTFEAGGRQYVVIAAGGSAKITEERQGDAIVAFALP